MLALLLVLWTDGCQDICRSKALWSVAAADVASCCSSKIGGYADATSAGPALLLPADAVMELDLPQAVNRPGNVVSSVCTMQGLMTLEPERPSDASCCASDAASTSRR